jgi:hypothetical protein
MIWKFSVNSERNWAAYAFEFSKNRSCSPKFAESIVVPVVENLFLEEFPVASEESDQVVGRRGRT